VLFYRTKSIFWTLHEQTNEPSSLRDAVPCDLVLKIL